MAPCSPPESPLLQVRDVPAEGVGRILTEKPPLGPREAGVSRGDTEPSLREGDGAEPGPLRPWSASPASALRHLCSGCRELVQMLAVGSWAARPLPSRSLGSGDGDRCRPTMIPSRVDSGKGRNPQGA